LFAWDTGGIVGFKCNIMSEWVALAHVLDECFEMPTIAAEILNYFHSHEAFIVIDYFSVRSPSEPNI